VPLDEVPLAWYEIWWGRSRLTLEAEARLGVLLMCEKWAPASRVRQAVADCFGCSSDTVSIAAKRLQAEDPAKLIARGAGRAREWLTILGGKPDYLVQRFFVERSITGTFRRMNRGVPLDAEQLRRAYKTTVFLAFCDKGKKAGPRHTWHEAERERRRDRRDRFWRNLMRPGHMTNDYEHNLYNKSSDGRYLPLDEIKDDPRNQEH
jgi:hypothetical protein